MKSPEERTCTIMPGTSMNFSTLKMCQDAVTYHKDTCKADLLFIDNTCENPAQQDAMRETVEECGYTYEYSGEPFSWTKLCNYGANKVKNQFDFVVFSNADVIFYPHWLHYLHEQWGQGDNPEFFSVHPFAYSPFHTGENYLSHPAQENRMVPIANPLMHVSLFRTHPLYKWDEQFTLYEADCDYWFWLDTQQQQAGISYLSRVDHATGGIVTAMGKRNIKVDLNGQDAFRDKWAPLIKRNEDNTEE